MCFTQQKEKRKGGGGVAVQFGFQCLGENLLFTFFFLSFCLEI
jgi:hypothetical protein